MLLVSRSYSDLKISKIYMGTNFLQPFKVKLLTFKHVN